MGTPRNRQDVAAIVDPDAGHAEPLPKTEALHTPIVNSTAVSVIATDAHGIIRIFNPGADRLFGYPAADLVGRMTPADIADPEDVLARARMLSIELGNSMATGFEGLVVKAARGSEDVYELSCIRKDGSRFPAVIAVTALRDARDAIIGYVLIATDDTARRHAEDALFAERERAQVTLDSIDDAVIGTDAKGAVTCLNAAAERLTGWSGGEAEGLPLLLVFNVIDPATRTSIDHLSKVAVRVRQFAAGATRLLIRRDGSELPIEDTAAPIHHRDGRVAGAVIVFRDTSAARALAVRVEHVAHYDLLTELPNRALFHDRLVQAIVAARRQGTRVAVLLLDLDRFTHITDSLGETMGDALLQSVSARLLACVRGSDTVSRRHGDQFVTLLSPLQGGDHAAIVAEEMIGAVAAPHQIAEHVLHVTASVGISLYPDDGDQAERLIGLADEAMVRAKQGGRNNCRFFASQMNAPRVARRSLEISLGEALRRQEFALHYQPKVSLETSRMTGVEALVRWQHPTRGLVAPGEFVPIAEECGLILPIGRWVLREACRQARGWQDAGLRPIPVAVNVSAIEFRARNFHQYVANVLRDTGLDPQYLELEVTESVLMADAESTVAALHALKDLGVRLAIDDFGTGYSSLSYLSRFPIDTLKIDQSFVRGMARTGHRDTIIDAVIGMGRSLKLCVIAEGVETAAQLALLQELSCNEGQGFYFSRPVAAGVFAALVQHEAPPRPAG